MEQEWNYLTSKPLDFPFQQDKVIEFREKSDSSAQKVIELSHIANQAQIRFQDTNEVLKTLEERLSITEVRQ